MVIFDTTMDRMENSTFYNKYQEIIRAATKKGPFSANELQCLFLAYNKLARSNGKHSKNITRSQLYNIMQMMKIYDSYIIDRIVSTCCDHGITPERVLNLFSTLLSTDLEEKMEFAFKIYDAMGLGYLTPNVVAQRVSVMFKTENVEEEELVELTMDFTDFLFSKFDLDKDNTINFQEYRTIVSKQPMLLEFLGKIFPSIGTKEVVFHCLSLNFKRREDYDNRFKSL